MSNAISHWLIYVYVAIGGAAGASLRFFVSEIMLHFFGKGFPFATLTVNITGSLIMGILYGMLEQGIIEPSPTKTLLTIGFLGALTTFSTFSLDTFLLFQEGQTIKAILNVFLNVVLCIGAAAIGLFVVTTR
ncbi:fluoride efflux transporter CrcB [Thalassotalea agarivorans]|uniref:Fluoride-specific ion channel FluC n=1 Tax=Thalassotalea agarivorans TaxID=349064 RepID=A0A1I0D8Y5_THASX|nr:fluoride efflux transporter CrcB [Thalassotalea agarivorans]SET28711.1 camphor resistance protein CrcB [Thalassotalea agarivorans]